MSHQSDLFDSIATAEEAVIIEPMTVKTEGATINYEYPLHERIRTYLRLEHLKQLLKPQQSVDATNYSRYFDALFAILELCERSDVRTDVQKDLDRRRAQLQVWAQHPDVNQQQVTALAERVQHAIQSIQPLTRIGSHLKQDRLLSVTRQRFGMPGGTCNFDVPQLHFWLHQAQQKRDQDCQRWWHEFEILFNGLELELELLRGQAHFQWVVAEGGLLQESTEPLSLLRIRVPEAIPAYPVISGHKQRFSIRFLSCAPQQGKASFENDVEFELALCP
ncbi:Cell division protein ZapD [Pseudidiomarina piscicola]|uniref:Cell division protein ZapD n=1 Tax=Pseudidiomarina piscicola TaxID=2614830 RepID=A0A6S6WLW8_9GAMM|nr:cell division protein ZapD [Pseudidiomarina piscicola]CAB0151003.1 Cell division protein ZapD [Pseudidiomarina piscicola]VZT40514.1 Cell division protein ZapD [Pseudomonas aeruginosa]